MYKSPLKNGKRIYNKAKEMAEEFEKYKGKVGSNSEDPITGIK